MKIEQAIEEYEKVANFDWFTDEQIEVAQRCGQIAAWLRELQERRTVDSCKGCVYEGCDCLLCVTCRRICKDKYKPERRTE